MESKSVGCTYRVRNIQVKVWDAPIELEIYTREVAKKELGK